ncbi:MAG: hypothetical protein K2N24_01605 [Lachnospiraceae bacterium]|nr:hypothetical protein [Lachnospiraceae bacterium]
MNIALNSNTRMSTLRTGHFAPSRPESAAPAPTTSTASGNDQISISQEGQNELDALADKVAAKLNTMTKEDFMDMVDQWRSENQIELVVDPYRTVDPDGSIANKTYFESYLSQLEDSRSTIESYYAEAYKEALSCPSGNSLSFISGKYLCPWSGYFDEHMSANQRQWTYAQLRSMLTGTGVALNDPYALAASGGPKTVEQMDQIAKQAVKDKLDALIQERNMSKNQK